MSQSFIDRLSDEDLDSEIEFARAEVQWLAQAGESIDKTVDRLEVLEAERRARRS